MDSSIDTNRVYIIYHEYEQGRVTYRNIVAIALCREDAVEYCDGYDYIIVPVMIDTDLSCMDYIYVVSEEDYTMFASIMRFKSVHSTIDDAENASGAYCEIITLTNVDGVFC